MLNKDIFTKDILTKELIARVEDKILETYLKAQKIFQTNFDLPQISFDLTNATGGRAWIHKLQFNPILLVENVEDFIYRTVPHECAHAFCYRLFPYAKGHHGPNWKNIMRCLGLQPSRCHSYNISNTTARPRNFIYACSCQTFGLTKTIHNKILNGQKRRCLKCKGNITFIEVKEIDI